MIEDFAPQHYPIWIVGEETKPPHLAPCAPQPVIGWERESDGRYVAVVLSDDGRAGRCDSRDGLVLHYFTNEADAHDLREYLSKCQEPT